MKFSMRWIHRSPVTAAASLAVLLCLARASHEPTPVIAQPQDASASAAEARQADPEAFPRYPGLESSIDFWKNVFTRWSETDVVFHDRDDLSIIYRKIHQPVSDTPELYRRNEAAQEAIMERIREILLDLAERNPDPRTLSGDYEDVYDAFDGKGNPARWRQAADRIRVQRGIKEKFFTGLVHAGQYRPYILEIMREEGVPEEIAWLPLVESTFNLQARSSVGAAGVWQFMPGTGKLFMRVDATVDERLDPILAARGAARLLKQNYRGLGSWPLALTAYNHGYYGMQRAVREVGTNDYMTVRRFYEGPAFGFAGPLGSYEPFSNLSTGILTGLMWLGRLEIIPVVVLLTRSYWRA